MKTTAILVVVFLLGFSAFAAENEPYLTSAPMPFYPPIARTARIMGKVEVQYVINEQGETSEIEADGNKMLRDVAIQNVKDWKFAWMRPCACREKEKVIFLFNLTDQLVDEGPTSIVHWFGKSPVIRVEIEAPGGVIAQP